MYQQNPSSMNTRTRLCAKTIWINKIEIDEFWKKKKIIRKHTFARQIQEINKTPTKYKTGQLTHKTPLKDFGKCKEKSKMFDLSRTEYQKKKNLKRSRERNRLRPTVTLIELGWWVTDLRLASNDSLGRWWELGPTERARIDNEIESEWEWELGLVENDWTDSERLGGWASNEIQSEWDWEWWAEISVRLWVWGVRPS